MSDKKTLKERFAKIKEDAKEVISDNANKIKSKTGDLIEDAGSKVNVLKEHAEKQRRDLVNNFEKKIYRPVTLEQYNSVSFNMPKLIQVLDEDEHAGKESCKDAIGYNPRIENVNIFRVIKKSLKDTGINFIPNKEGIIYYQNPYELGEFINIDDYFDYIKKRRVNELQLIANKLGAKAITIKVKEQKKSFVSVDAKANKGLHAKIDGLKAGSGKEAGFEFSADNFTTIEIICNHKFEGGNPTVPELVYYKNDPDIESLVEMRMGNNPSKEKTYMLKFSRNSDINLTAAMGIDAVLEKLDIAASASVKSEVEKERRLYFEYHIEF